MTYEPLLIVGLMVIGYLGGRTKPLRYRTEKENGVRLSVEYLVWCDSGSLGRGVQLLV